MRGMNSIQVLFLVIFIAIAIGCSCDTSIFHLPRKLAGQNPEQNPKEVSPSPAPFGWSRRVADVTDERCLDSVTRRCSVEASHMTACVNYSDGALKSSFLLVQNDGENPLEVNVTIVDFKVTLPSMQISKHQAKKINISAILEGSPSIFLNAGEENCTIPLGSQERDGKVYKQFLADGITHFTPIYGVYFLFLITLIVGGAWTTWRIVSHGHAASWRKVMDTLTESDIKSLKWSSSQGASQLIIRWKQLKDGMKIGMMNGGNKGSEII